MGKKDFKGLRVYMKDPRKEKMRASRYFIDLITNHHSYNPQDIKLLAEGKITYDDVIKKLFNITKESDYRAFYLFKNSLNYLTGDYKMQKVKHAQVLLTNMDIVKLFDTDEKLHHFLGFMMEFVTTNTLSGNDLMIHINASFVIDYGVLLKILELWIIDYYEATEEEVRNYLYTYMMSFAQASFLTNCIFTHQYKILSTKVCDMIHCRNAKKLEIKKSWTDSIYINKDDTHVHLRQVAFSQKQLNNIVEFADNEYVDHPLNSNTYNKFKENLKSSNLTQILYGKEATDLARERRKQENPIPYFFKYSR